MEQTRGQRALALYGRPYFWLLARVRWGRVELEALSRHRAGRLKGGGSRRPTPVYKHGVRVHNQVRKRVVEKIIGRLSELAGPQIGRLEDELRLERKRRASSAGGGRDAPRIREGAAPPVTEVLEYRPRSISETSRK